MGCCFSTIDVCVEKRELDVQSHHDIAKAWDAKPNWHPPGFPDRCTAIQSSAFVRAQRPNQRHGGGDGGDGGDGGGMLGSVAGAAGGGTCDGRREEGGRGQRVTACVWLVYTVGAWWWWLVYEGGGRRGPAEEREPQFGNVMT